MSRDIERHVSKVPEITIVFWIIKIAATTLGETGGDTVTMTLNWGYLGGTALFFSVLVIFVVWQIRAEKFHPFLYRRLDHRLFFLSDRSGPISLFSYDTRSKRVAEALKNDGLDFKYASMGPGAIVIEQFGAIYLYDLKSGQARKVDIRVTGDLPETRPHFLNVANRIEAADISPYIDS